MVFVQRSRGYAVRRSLSVADIAALVAVVREAHPAAVVFVDNCYGELVEEREPLEAGRRRHRRLADQEPRRRPGARPAATSPAAPT